jgi:Leucine-rich repeat (LRR) protein
LNFYRTFENNNLLGSISEGIYNLSNLKVLSIVSIEQNEYILKGTLSPSIGFLTSLESFTLLGIGIKGSIPSEIGNLSSLKRLILGSVSLPFVAKTFIGILPKSLCDLTSLEVLDLSKTGIQSFRDGKFCFDLLPNLVDLRMSWTPKFVIDMSFILTLGSKLRHLDMSYSPITAPNSWINLLPETIEHIDIHSSQVSGVIYQSLWELPNLRYIDFGSTATSGAISYMSCNWNRLEYLDFSNTGITGLIPNSITNCTLLKTLILKRLPIGCVNTSMIWTLPNLEEVSISTSLGLTSLRNVFPKTGNILKIRKIILTHAHIMEETIPQWIADSSTLEYLDLSDNQIKGSLPDFGPNIKYLDLHNNLLSGSIPYGLANNVESLILHHNRFDELHNNFFANNSKLIYLDLSWNMFQGPLPILSTMPFNDSGSGLKRIISFNHNQFSGHIPESYGQSHVSELILSNNMLIGSLEMLTIENNIELEYLDVRSNQFSGPLNHIKNPILSTLIVSDNAFKSTLPMIPLSVQLFDGSHNKFYGSLDSIIENSRFGDLSILDLSFNDLVGNLPPEILIANLTFLSLSNNDFSLGLNKFEYLEDDPFARPQIRFLQELDLANNRFHSGFPKTRRGLKFLTSLRLANSAFGGELDFANMPFLTNLDISRNAFSFEVSKLSMLSFLESIDASNNKIDGILSLAGLSLLRTADLSSNSFDSAIDFESIGKLFSSHLLQHLSITNNPAINISLSLSSNLTGLHRSTTSSPSTIFPGVSCFNLEFNKRALNGNTTFWYDEDLFEYSNCDCSKEHFGIPPTKCFTCPLIGTSNCGGSSLHISPNFFIYPIDTSEMSSSTFPYGIESCIINLNGLVRGTNCNGFPININRIESNVITNITIQSLISLKEQCPKGSEGRLCSRCTCDTSGEGKCFFPSGTVCKLCNKVMNIKRFIQMSIGILILIILVLAVVMFFLLRSKRTVQNLSWKDLSLLKRVSYRLILTSTLGNITILITFIQLVSEMTHWDAYAFNAWTKMLNGDTSGFSLVCIFPSLSKPMVMLLSRLLLPLIALIIAASSIGLSEMAHRVLSSFNPSHSVFSIQDSDIDYNDESSSSSSSSSSMDNISLIIQIRDDISSTSNYPASALLSTISISILRFFYFSSALAAHEYLFSVTQSITNLKYVQAHPWMKFGDAQILRNVSFPFIALFVVGLPIAFLVLAWNVRHTFSSPSVQIYFGSLFESFSRTFFWWEIVNVVRKLGIALALRGTEPSSAVQPILILLIIGSLEMMLAMLNPWKRRWENCGDLLSGWLLVLNLVASRSSELSKSEMVFRFTIIMNMLFILANVAIIIYLTITEETDYEKRWKLKYATKTLTESGIQFEDPIMKKEINIMLCEEKMDHKAIRMLNNEDSPIITHTASESDDM